MHYTLSQCELFIIFKNTIIINFIVHRIEKVTSDDLGYDTVLSNCHIYITLSYNI
jgi:hypothetical protein